MQPSRILSLGLLLVVLGAQAHPASAALPAQLSEPQAGPMAFGHWAPGASLAELRQALAHSRSWELAYAPNAVAALAQAMIDQKPLAAERLVLVALHGGADVAEEAAQALAKHGTAQAAWDLAQGLPQATSGRSQQLGWAIAARGEAQALGPLRPLLRSPRSDLRAIAHLVVGYLGEANDRPALVRALGDADAKVAQAAATALVAQLSPLDAELNLAPALRLGGRPGARAHQVQAAVVRHWKEHQVAREGLRRLAEPPLAKPLSPPGDLGARLRLLGEPSDGMRSDDAQQVLPFLGQEALPQLEAELGGPAGPLAAAALALAAPHSGERYVAKLAPLLAKHQGMDRELVAVALEALGPDAVAFSIDELRAARPPFPDEQTAALPLGPQAWPSSFAPFQPQAPEAVLHALAAWGRMQDTEALLPWWRPERAWVAADMARRGMRQLNPGMAPWLGRPAAQAWVSPAYDPLEPDPSPSRPAWLDPTNPPQNWALAESLGIWDAVLAAARQDAELGGPLLEAMVMSLGRGGEASDMAQRGLLLLRDHKVLAALPKAEAQGGLLASRAKLLRARALLGQGDRAVAIALWQGLAASASWPGVGLRAKSYLLQVALHPPGSSQVQPQAAAQAAAELEELAGDAPRRMAWRERLRWPWAEAELRLQAASLWLQAKRLDQARRAMEAAQAEARDWPPLRAEALAGLIAIAQAEGREADAARLADQLWRVAQGYSVAMEAPRLAFGRAWTPPNHQDSNSSLGAGQEFDASYGGEAALYEACLAQAARWRVVMRFPARAALARAEQVRRQALAP